MKETIYRFTQRNEGIVFGTSEVIHNISTGQVSYEIYFEEKLWNDKELSIEGLEMVIELLQATCDKIKEISGLIPIKKNSIGGHHERNTGSL